MNRLSPLKLMSNCAALILAALLAPVGQAHAQTSNEVKVMISGGFNTPFEALAPQFEAKYGVKITTVQGPSMGASPQAIPTRLERGEKADVVILADSALEKLIDQGRVIPSSRTDLVKSLIAMAVKEGAPVPKLTTKDDLIKVLLDAKSVAVSSSASGVYLSTRMYQALGIQEQLKDKTRTITTEPVAKVVARGEADVGFQQLSELKPIKGITIVGPIPPEVQKTTVFSAGVVKGAPNEKAAYELVRFLSSDVALPVIRESGLEPAAK